MSTSLQEQLIQAGLADEESLNRSSQGRKRGADKGKGGRGKGGGRKPRQSPRAPAEGGPEQPAAAAKPRREPEPAAQRPPTAEQTADRLGQMIRANRIDRAYATVPYRFTQGSRIRELAVTGTQQARIARGEMGVVSDGARCELVPAKVARRIRAIDREAVLVLNTGDDRKTGDSDDPYAEYHVPDDLMW